MTSQLEVLAHLENQARMNLRDFIESCGGFRDDARFAWGQSPVVWRVSMGVEPNDKEISGINNDETGDFIDFATCASLPAEGWRIIE